MTQKEFLKAVAEGNLTDEVQEYARVRFDKMDKQDQAKKEMDAELYIAAYEAIADGKSTTASETKDIIGVSVQKTSSVLRGLVKEGKLRSEDAIVGGRVTKHYYLV
jgi:hypothetical protein